MASNVVLNRDPRRVLPGPAHQAATLLLDQNCDIKEDAIVFRGLTMFLLFAMD
jgi:hypothetical protein